MRRPPCWRSACIWSSTDQDNRRFGPLPLDVQEFILSIADKLPDGCYPAHINEACENREKWLPRITNVAALPLKGGVDDD